MDKDKFKLGDYAVSNTGIVGWLSKSYKDTVCIQSGKIEHTFKWCDVQLLDDLDCEWDGEKLIVNYTEVTKEQNDNADKSIVSKQKVSKSNLEQKGVSMSNKMSKEELRVHLLSNPGEYTMNDVKALSGLAMQSCREALKMLEAQGKVHKSGQTRGTKWVVTG